MLAVKRTGAGELFLGFWLERWGCGSMQGFFAYVYKARIHIPPPGFGSLGGREGGEGA